MSSLDISSNPDFQQLQALQLSQVSEMQDLKELQLSQVSEMQDLRSTMNRNFMEFGKQLTELCKTHKGKEPKDSPESSNSRPASINHNRSFSQPVSNCHNLPFSQTGVDLDSPQYASNILYDNNYYPAKHIKVGMPRFNGINAEHWLFAVCRYFIFNKVLEEQKLLIASFHLDGIARTWFAWTEASNQLTTCKNFVEALVRKFTTYNYCQLGRKLSKLCQEGIVVEYQGKFVELCTRVLGLPDAFILEMYISGLKDSIQSEVVRDKPNDIHEAFELSLLVESQQKGQKLNYWKPFVPKQTRFTNTFSSPSLSSPTIASHMITTPMENHLKVRFLFLKTFAC